MKSITMSIFVLSVAASLAAAAERGQQAVPGTGFKAMPADVRNPSAEVMGDEELLKLRGNVSSVPKEQLILPRAESEYSLTALSSFLASEGVSTLVPKGSVIFCPDKLSKKRVTALKGKPVPWNDFLTRNRAWIRTMEVSMLQAQGKAPISEVQMKIYQEAKVMVVATFQGNPITVLEAKAAP